LSCLEYIKSLNCNYEKNNGTINFYYSGILFSVKEPTEKEHGYIRYKHKLLSDTFFSTRIKDNNSFKNKFERILASA
jgi:hypothetical protein